MKTYYNEKTNKWYEEGNSITVLYNNVLFSGIPTPKQLSDWGYEEYNVEPPVYERTLDVAKQERLLALSNYDNSENVNSFLINDTPMWITPNDRTNYMSTMDSAKRLGMELVSFLGHEIYIDDAINMLDAINLYAMSCVYVTDMHKNAINALDTVEAVDNYDFKTGYPEKLVFEI